MPTNSLATTGDAGSSKSSLSWLTLKECTSPPMHHRVRSLLLGQGTRAAAGAPPDSRPSRRSRRAGRGRACWSNCAMSVCCASTFQRARDSPRRRSEPALLRARRACVRPGSASSRAVLDVERVRAAAPARARAGLPRAVLAGVEHVEAREPAPVEVGVDAHVAALGAHARRQRHVLVVGLVGGGAALEERRRAPCRPRAGRRRSRCRLRGRPR